MGWAGAAVASARARRPTPEWGALDASGVMAAGRRPPAITSAGPAPCRAQFGGRAGKFVGPLLWRQLGGALVRT